MADKILEVTASRINAAVKKVENLPEQGVTGADGKSAYQIWLEQGNRGTEQDFLNSLKGQDGTQGIQGEKGADGITPNITIGTVTTLEAGQQATVTKTGTKEEPIFNFGIPKGQKGADGVGGSVEGHTHSNKTELDKIVEGDKAKWDAKSDFSGNYNDLTEKPTKLSQFQNDIGLSGGSGANVEIVNDLTTGGANKALSAEQGKVIKSSLDNITTTLPLNYEPKIQTKNSAFNKNFGTTSNTVAEGNHTHNGYANNDDIPTDLSFSNKILKLKKADGTEIGTGVTIEGGSDFSKVDLKLEGTKLSLTNEGSSVGNGVELPIYSDSPNEVSNVIFEFEAVHKSNMIVGNVGIDTRKYKGMSGALVFEFKPTTLSNSGNITIGYATGETYSDGYINGTSQTVALNTVKTITINNNVTLSSYTNISFKIAYNSASDTNSTGIIKIVLDNLKLTIGGTEISKKYFTKATNVNAYTGVCTLINIKCTPFFTPTKLVTRWQGKRYLAIGDSITASINDSSDNSLRYPEKIGQILGCDVINIARSGQTMSATNPNNSFYLKHKTYSYNYDLITIALGVNDGGAGGSVSPIGDVDSEDSLTFLGAYNLVLKHIFTCNPYATVVLIPPIHGSHQKAEYIQAVKDIGKKYCCPVFDVYSMGINNINQSVYHDGLHYYEQGHTIYANKLSQFLATV